MNRISVTGFPAEDACNDERPLFQLSAFALKPASQCCWIPKDGMMPPLFLCHRHNYWQKHLTPILQAQRAAPGWGSARAVCLMYKADIVFLRSRGRADICLRSYLSFPRSYHIFIFPKIVSESPTRNFHKLSQLSKKQADESRQTFSSTKKIMRTRQAALNF